MSLQDLGNIGEFVSAVAVVVSLLYLAVQIRQNTRSLRAGAHHSITAHIAELNRTIVENGEVAHILELGLADLSALSPEQLRRFNAYNSARFRHYDNLYYQYCVGTLEKSQWRGLETLLQVHLQQPGLATWWRGAAEFYSSEFVDCVRELQARPYRKVVEEARAELEKPLSDSGDLW